MELRKDLFDKILDEYNDIQRKKVNTASAFDKYRLIAKVQEKINRLFLKNRNVLEKIKQKTMFEHESGNYYLENVVNELGNQILLTSVKHEENKKIVLYTKGVNAREENSITIEELILKGTETKSIANNKDEKKLLSIVSNILKTLEKDLEVLASDKKMAEFKELMKDF